MTDRTPSPAFTIKERMRRGHEALLAMPDLPEEIKDARSTGAARFLGAPVYRCDHSGTLEVMDASYRVGLPDGTDAVLIEMWPPRERTDRAGCVFVNRMAVPEGLTMAPDEVLMLHLSLWEFSSTLPDGADAEPVPMSINVVYARREDGTFDPAGEFTFALAFNGCRAEGCTGPSTCEECGRVLEEMRENAPYIREQAAMIGTSVGNVLRLINGQSSPLLRNEPMSDDPLYGERGWEYRQVLPPAVAGGRLN